MLIVAYQITDCVINAFFKNNRYWIHIIIINCKFVDFFSPENSTRLASLRFYIKKQLEENRGGIMEDKTNVLCHTLFRN